MFEMFLPTIIMYLVKLQRSIKVRSKTIVTKFFNIFLFIDRQKSFYLSYDRNYILILLLYNK